MSVFKIYMYNSTFLKMVLKNGARSDKINQIDEIINNEMEEDRYAEHKSFREVFKGRADLR